MRNPVTGGKLGIRFNDFSFRMSSFYVFFSKNQWQQLVKELITHRKINFCLMKLMWTISNKSKGLMDDWILLEIIWCIMHSWNGDYSPWNKLIKKYSIVFKIPVQITTSKDHGQLLQCSFLWTLHSWRVVGVHSFHNDVQSYTMTWMPHHLTFRHLPICWCIQKTHPEEF